MFSENNYSTDGFDIFEGMTSISAVINSINNGTNDRKIIKILYDRSRAEKKCREIAYLKIMSERLSFELEETCAETLEQMTSGKTHGGFVAICSKRVLPSLNELTLQKKGFFVLLEGVEDPYNFGYSVRSLYASGADGIILPERNWMELSSTVARSSAGSSELANIYVCDPLECVKYFKDNGFKVACAGIRDSVSLYDADFTLPTLLVVGGEKRGVSRKILDLCDYNVRIDYGCEFKGSLPTASAVSVIAFEALRQRSRKV